MKLVSYIKDGHDRLAVLVNNYLYDMELLHPDLPTSMGMFLNYWEDVYPMALEGVRMIEEGKTTANKGISIDICDGEGGAVAADRRAAVPLSAGAHRNARPPCGRVRGCA